MPRQGLGEFLRMTGPRSKVPPLSEEFKRNTLEEMDNGKKRRVNDLFSEEK